MSKYRKAFLISVASIVLTLTGFSVCGSHHSVRLASRPIDTAAPPLRAPIEAGARRIRPPAQMVYWL
jgi:hypothetical protein